MNRLSLYNEALRLCGERKLASLTEAREPRRLLDAVWDNEGVLRCLEAGQWQFATRTVQIDYSSSIEPDFGFTRAFDKPTDFVRTCAVCADEFFNVPLNEYTDEASYWFSDLDTIFVKYVSDDNSYGNDMSLWPGTFGAYAAAAFAHGIIINLTQDEKRWAVVDRIKKKALSDALAKDAMAEPTKFLPSGSWVNARGRRTRRDGGPRGSLT